MVVDISLEFIAVWLFIGLSLYMGSLYSSRREKDLLREGKCTFDAHRITNDFYLKDLLIKGPVGALLWVGSSVVGYVVFKNTLLYINQFFLS